jgi:coiled-coil-helix-coiled-coil-helix domain-containing protein 2
MRDDEDHIRQFMPVLRRIVILVAVLTAIPVVMWTITAFVRIYVGPPKTPTFQRIADAPPGSTPNASTAAPSDNATTGSAQTSPPPAPIVEAKATATDADANAPMPDSNAATPAGEAASAAPTNAAPDPAFPNVTVPNSPPAPVAMEQTAAATNDAAPTNAAAPGTAPGSAGPGAAGPGAAGTADLAAPSAHAYAAPGDAAEGGGNGMQVAAQQPAPTNWPTSQPPAVDSSTPGQPIAGLVPLPRKRPKTFELAQGGPIPMPMPRPGVAGAGAEQAPSTPFDWLQHVFHAASDHAGSDASAQ